MIELNAEIKKEIEELKNSENIIEEEKNPVTSENRELSDFEQKMVKKGWDPNGKKSAEEWLDAGFDIRGKNVKSLNQTVEYLKNYVERQEKEAYAKALADIQYQKREAIELSDVQRVEELDRKQKNLMDTETLNLVNDFKQKHADWLNGTSHQALKMAEFCDLKDRALAERNLSPKKHLEALENYIVGEFPDYFRNNTKEEFVPLVEGRQSTAVRSSNKKEFTFNDLTDIQKKIAKNLVDRKVMTMDQYIKDLVKQGDLK